MRILVQELELRYEGFKTIRADTLFLNTAGKKDIGAIFDSTFIITEIINAQRAGSILEWNPDDGLLNDTLAANANKLTLKINDFTMDIIYHSCNTNTVRVILELETGLEYDAYFNMKLKGRKSGFVKIDESLLSKYEAKRYGNYIIANRFKYIIERNDKGDVKTSIDFGYVFHVDQLLEPSIDLICEDENMLGCAIGKDGKHLKTTIVRLREIGYLIDKISVVNF